MQYKLLVVLLIAILLVSITAKRTSNRFALSRRALVGAPVSISVNANAIYDLPILIDAPGTYTLTNPTSGTLCIRLSNIYNTQLCSFQTQNTHTVQSNAGTKSSHDIIVKTSSVSISLPNTDYCVSKHVTSPVDTYQSNLFNDNYVAVCTDFTTTPIMNG
jgi:hypothetical protein